MAGGRFSTTQFRLEGFLIIVYLLFTFVAFVLMGMDNVNMFGGPMNPQILWILISIVLLVIVVFGVHRVLKTINEEFSGVVETLSSGNFRAVYSEELINESDPYYPIYRSLASVSDRVGSVIGDLDYATRLIRDSIEQIRETSSQMARSSEGISQIMEQISMGTQNQADEAQTAMEALEALKNQIDNSFRRIFESLNVMDEISEETNLLALNASIEAERAGEHGKGFAVVARKVRELADQSKDYSEQVYELIESIEQQIRASQYDVEQKLKQISEISENTAAGAEQVSASAQEQTASMEELVAATSELSRLASQLQDVLKKLRVIAEEAREAKEASISLEKELP